MLIFNVPYKSDYFTNEEILVNDYTIEDKIFRYPSAPETARMTDTFNFKDVILKCYVICKEDKEDVLVIHEASEQAYKEVMKLIRKNISSFLITWKHYFEFQEQFADMKYNHALTVHKSQGSTYKQVIVNIKNIKRNRNKSEQEKMLYTAITRTAELLILYNV